MEATKLFPDAIRWDLLYYISITLFPTIIIFNFFKPFWAAIVSYTLICCWSRIPCHMSDHLKDLEVIDFFSVLIALHVGALAGGLFAQTVHWLSASFGKLESPLWTFNAANGLMFGALASPFLYNYFNQNLLLTMYGFTVIRYLGGYFTVMFTARHLLPQMLAATPSCLFTAYVHNTVMVLYFGDYFTTNLINKGIVVDWGLVGFMGLILSLIVLKKYGVFSNTGTNKAEIKSTYVPPSQREQKPNYQQLN